MPCSAPALYQLLLRGLESRPLVRLLLPQGTNYTRTNPLAEISSASRDAFWEQQEAEERRRKQEEQAKKDEQMKLIERERKQREVCEEVQYDTIFMRKNESGSNSFHFYRDAFMW